VVLWYIFLAVAGVMNIGLWPLKAAGSGITAAGKGGFAIARKAGLKAAFKTTSKKARSGAGEIRCISR